MNYRIVTNCRICNSTRLRKYLDLGNLPLANGLLNYPSTEFRRYPLQVLFCDECSLSQLSIIVDPKTLYKDYPYHSSVSETFKKHCLEMANTVKEILGPKECTPLSPILDIAANDGCLLEQFKAVGFEWLVAVEPAENLIKECEKKGLRTVKGFWNDETAKIVPGCDVITATNVLAHVDDVKGFVTNIAKSLSRVRNSFCVIEFPYLVDLISKVQFDTIYHEHLSYFLFKPIKRLFKECGLRIFRVDRLSIHGGSLRIYACHEKYQDFEKSTSSGKDYDKKLVDVPSEDVYPTEKSVKELERFEKTQNLYDFKTYQKFAEKILEIKDFLQKLLLDLKRKRKKVVGYGASAKGTTLLNYCNVDSTHIKAIVDDTKAKQGKFIPGCKIPIVSKDYLDKEQPDYIVLLSWNFSTEIIQKTLKFKERGVRYILPVPQVEVL